MSRKRVVVVCPGRGSYTKESLGYLSPYKNQLKGFLTHIDEKRKAAGDPSITELDSANAFKTSVHTKGEHASPLIYACSYLDFSLINTDKFEVVAVTGNSMGWYLALAMAGALDQDGSFQLIQTMGGMMREGLIGGQIIYPIVDENWQVDEQKKKAISEVVDSVRAQPGCEAFVSIFLGGYMVLAGNKEGVRELLEKLPKEGDFPFQLINHGAFHTPLLTDVSQKAFGQISSNLFNKPKIPMVDGRGHIWKPYSTNIEELYEYTLGHQVVQPYDFSSSISVALKEFAPDHLVLLGPGNSLGGAMGQIMIQNHWKKTKSKADFTKRQKENPFLISMGNLDQKSLML